MTDVLWAQYCILLQLTIHDGLFDRHDSNLALIFAANQFQVEADRALSKYFARTSQFWKVYRTSLIEGNDAIIELRSLRSSKAPKAGDILALHAKACAIFKIGSAAVCAKLDQMRDFSRASRVVDELAKTGQALDDLTDIQEDLEGGELNYASAYFLQGHRKRMPARKHALEGILHALKAGDVAPQFLQELRVHLHKARRALQPLQIDAAREYFRKYEARLNRVEEHLHQQRIRLIFGELARSSKRGEL